MAKERNELGQMLGNMIADNNFFMLDQRLSTPNMFSILKMEYQKPNYNSLLAYLLNPHENHGLEDRFLRMFLSNAMAAKSIEDAIPTSGLSPIPYETVTETILNWDQLDILSADLRETMVCADYPLGDEGRTVDICIWNDSYSFVVYIENFISVKEGWRRYHGTAKTKDKSHAREYLLDLYKQWASDDSDLEYQILPVFMTMGEMIPDEQYLTRILGYEWMVDVLKPFLNGSNISPHARILMEDLIEFLKREMPQSLDLELHNELTLLSDHYGPVICRLYDHITECRGCENENELIVAYHDIYRRHKKTMDILWLFTDSQKYEILDEIEKEIKGLGFDDELILTRTASTISGISKSWIPKEKESTLYSEEHQPLAEVYFSGSVGCCGIFIYREPSFGMVNKIWMVAQELAEERDLELAPRKPNSRNFHLAKVIYDGFNTLDIARDFVRYYQLLNDIIEELTP
jgi:PD-(D/E)XK nuclease superfamily